MTGGGGMDRERVLSISGRALERVERRLRTAMLGKFSCGERLTDLQRATREEDERMRSWRERLSEADYPQWALGNFAKWREEIVRLGMGDMLRAKRDEEDES